MKTLPSAFLLLLATASSADAALRGSSMGSRQLASPTGGAAVGGWECWTTNGIPTTTVSYGFSVTDDQSTSQSHKQDLSATATAGFSMAGVSGSVSITGSIGQTWGSAIKHSKTESSTTTITTQCPPEFCPTSGEARTANICQWTMYNDVAKFASKTILFAPTGESPRCAVNPLVPGTWCDMAHDSYCSRCTQQTCEEYPSMPGCEWFVQICNENPKTPGCEVYVQQSSVVGTNRGPGLKEISPGLLSTLVPSKTQGGPIMPNSN